MSDSPTSLRGTAINLGLLAAAGLIFVACLLIGGRATSDGAAEESFVGTDTTAVTSIEDNHPDYTPWFEQIFAPPSAEVESGLFALQAALGAGVFGYALGALRRRRAAPAAGSGAGDDSR
jgi:cobalt/nickel transport protein